MDLGCLIYDALGSIWLFFPKASKMDSAAKFRISNIEFQISNIGHRTSGFLTFFTLTANRNTIRKQVIGRKNEKFTSGTPKIVVSV